MKLWNVLSSMITISLFAAVSLAPACADNGPDEEMPALGFVAGPLSAGASQAWFGASRENRERGAEGEVSWGLTTTAAVQMDLLEGMQWINVHAWKGVTYRGAMWVHSTDMGQLQVNVGATQKRTVRIPTSPYGDADLAANSVVYAIDPNGHACRPETFGQLIVKGEPNTSVLVVAPASVRFVPAPVEEYCASAVNWTATASGTIGEDGFAIFDFGVLPQVSTGFAEFQAQRTPAGGTQRGTISLVVRLAREIRMNLTAD